MITRIWPILLAAVAQGINGFVIAGILPAIAASLHVTPGRVGLGVTAFTAAYAITGPVFAGRLVARVSTRSALLFALGLFIVGNLFSAVSPTVEVFLLARAVAGAGAGLLTPIATATAGASVPAAQRLRGMAMMTFGNSLGTVAGVPAGMVIADVIGWRWTMGVIVVLASCSLIAIAWPTRTWPQLTGGRAEGARAAVRPTLVVGTALTFVTGIGAIGLYTYLLPVTESRGLAWAAFGLVCVWGTGGAVGAYAATRLVDRFAPRRLLIIPPVALAVAFLAFMLSSSPVVWVGATILWSACGWSSVAIGQSALTQHRPQEAVRVVAWLMAAMNLGAAVGSAGGSALLGVGVSAGDLPAWAAAVMVLGAVLAAGLGRALAREQAGGVR